MLRRNTFLQVGDEAGETDVALGEVGQRGEVVPAFTRGPATGGAVSLPGHISSQFLSGLLLAAPLRARGVQVDFTRRLLKATGSTPGQFGCFGLHEWAMVFEQDEADRCADFLRDSSPEAAEALGSG